MAEMAERYDDSVDEAMIVRSHAEVSRFFDGLELVGPGVVTIDRWEGSGTDTDPPEEMGHAGVRSRRPQAVGGAGRRRHPGRLGHQEELRGLDRRVVPGVGAGVTDHRPATSSPAAAARSRSSRGVKHVVHRSTARGAAVLVPHLGALVVDPGPGVERVAVLQPPHLEVGGEGRHRRHAARPQRPGDPVQHLPVAVERGPGPPASPNAPWHSDTAASNSPS